MGKLTLGEYIQKLQRIEKIYGEELTLISVSYAMGTSTHEEVFDNPSVGIFDDNAYDFVPVPNQKHLNEVVNSVCLN